jgi:hypothetical protein
MAHYVHGPVSIDDQDGPIISIGEPINVRREPTPDDDPDDGSDTRAAAIIVLAMLVGIALVVGLVLWALGVIG